MSTTPWTGRFSSWGRRARGRQRFSWRWPETYSPAPPMTRHTRYPLSSPFRLGLNRGNHWSNGSKDELNLRYDVPTGIAQEWVAADQILPLLDGLDEVRAEHRPACVEAVNAFRQSHGFLPVVITSRLADYDSSR